MKEIGKAFGVFMGIAALIFILPVIGVAFGAFSGWAVGLVFDQTFDRFLGAAGMPWAEPWQAGAALGFIGGFFKPATNSKG